MNRGIEAGLEIFPEKRFCRKFVGEAYESRFNRAVFDVQVGALSNRSLREKALDEPLKFIRAFETASSMDGFVSSVETTTKTAAATNTRFSLFYSAVNREFDTNLLIPRIKEPEE